MHVSKNPSKFICLFKKNHDIHILDTLGDWGFLSTLFFCYFSVKHMVYGHVLPSM